MLGIKHGFAAKPIGIFFLFILIFMVTWLVNRNSQTIVRLIANQEIGIKTLGFMETETPNFIIKYTETDSPYIDIIAFAAEDAYDSVGQFFQIMPTNKTTIIVYPNEASLAKSFGWDKNEKAMGVYWGGSIRVLSPQAWLKGPQLADKYVKEGPMVHEFTHLIVDEITKGNYTRWWTEAIAQYAEKKITGFAFVDPFSGDMERYYYTIDKLEKNYEALNQSVAYWQSLKTAEYIAECYHEDRLFDILDYLGQGKTLSNAVTLALGTDYTIFETEFYQWLENK